MRQLLIVIAFIAGTGITHGQHTEFSLQAGSGLFSFGGPGAVSQTLARPIAGIYPSGYTINPFSRAGGLYYELTIGVKRMTSSRIIYGLQTGYEAEQSEVAIVGYRYDGPLYDYPDVVKAGRTRVRNQYANLLPFVGKRFNCHRFDLDVTTGLDTGFGVSSRESAAIASSIGNYTVNTSRPIPNVDLRPRLNLTGYYRAFGLSLGYSHGLTNYALHTGGNAGAYSRLWRIGMVYRLVKRA